MRDFEKTFKDFLYPKRNIDNCAVLRSTGPFAITFSDDILEISCKLFKNRTFKNLFNECITIAQFEKIKRILQMAQLLHHLQYFF